MLQLVKEHAPILYRKHTEHRSDQQDDFDYQQEENSLYHHIPFFMQNRDYNAKKLFLFIHPDKNNNSTLSLILSKILNTLNQKENDFFRPEEPFAHNNHHNHNPYDVPQDNFAIRDYLFTPKRGYGEYNFIPTDNQYLECFTLRYKKGVYEKFDILEDITSLCENKDGLEFNQREFDNIMNKLVSSFKEDIKSRVGINKSTFGKRSDMSTGEEIEKTNDLARYLFLTINSQRSNNYVRIPVIRYLISHPELCDVKALRFTLGGRKFLDNEQLVKTMKKLDISFSADINNLRFLILLLYMEPGPVTHALTVNDESEEGKTLLRQYNNLLHLAIETQDVKMQSLLQTLVTPFFIEKKYLIVSYILDTLFLIFPQYSQFKELERNSASAADMNQIRDWLGGMLPQDFLQPVLKYSIFPPDVMHNLKIYWLSQGKTPKEFSSSFHNLIQNSETIHTYLKLDPHIDPQTKEILCKVIEDINEFSNKKIYHFPRNSVDFEGYNVPVNFVHHSRSIFKEDDRSGLWFLGEPILHPRFNTYSYVSYSPHYSQYNNQKDETVTLSEEEIEGIKGLKASLFWKNKVGFLDTYVTKIKKDPIDRVVFIISKNILNTIKELKKEDPWFLTYSDHFPELKNLKEALRVAISQFIAQLPTLNQRQQEEQAKIRELAKLLEIPL